jgi:hypothetical protein
MIASGHDPKQAVAAGYRNQRAAKAKAKPKAKSKAKAKPRK